MYVATLAALYGGTAVSASRPRSEKAKVIRVATLNVSLTRNIEGQLARDLATGTDSQARAIAQLLEHPRVRADPTPRSRGAEPAALRQRGANLAQRGSAAEDSADFADAPPAPGNLRVDYVLPSREFAICANGVYWPDDDEELVRASDHRLVRVDLGIVHCPLKNVRNRGLRERHRSQQASTPRVPPTERRPT